MYYQVNILGKSEEEGGGRKIRKKWVLWNYSFGLDFILLFFLRFSF